MTDKIVSINTLAENFASEKDLQSYCDQQYILIQELRNENKKLTEEVEHLKFIIASNTEILPSNETVQIVVSKEQALLEEQITIIQQRSFGKELTLEDTKKLDLLIKNLKIVKEDSPKTFDIKSKKFKATTDKLLEVASQSVPENNGQS